MSNFRQTYYGKLGYKGAEGKLEVLLDEKKVKDLNKLKLFAEEFMVLTGHRLSLWGYLSSESVRQPCCVLVSLSNTYSPIADLFPIYPNNHKYVIEQRIQQFQDLQSAVCWFVDDTAALEHTYYTMWMLETNRMPFGGSGKAVAASDDQHPFEVIARAMIKMFPDTECQYQVYWITKAVYELAVQPDIDGLVAQTYSELETYDASLFRWVIWAGEKKHRF